MGTLPSDLNFEEAYERNLEVEIEEKAARRRAKAKKSRAKKLKAKKPKIKPTTASSP